MVSFWGGHTRGCFVNLQANDSFTPSEALDVLLEAQHTKGPGSSPVAALHIGYPHLMRHFQASQIIPYPSSGLWH